jgi:hypothetical protein
VNYKAKYILFADRNSVFPIVFSETMQHIDVARCLRPLTPESAGFCYIEEGRYVCYGESVSLGIKSNGDADGILLNKYLGVDC